MVVLVHIMRTMPLADVFLDTDPGNAVSPWWNLAKWAGEAPGIFPLGLHRYAKGHPISNLLPLLGEELLLGYASPFVIIAPATDQRLRWGFFRFLASGLLHHPILGLLRAGAPRQSNLSAMGSGIVRFPDG